MTELTRATEPFRFYTRLHLTELTGMKAANLVQLLRLLKSVPGGSIYYHTHHFLQQHQYLSPDPPNDFSYWVGEILGEAELSERLASVDIVQFSTIRGLREKIIETIEEYLDEKPEAKARFPRRGVSFTSESQSVLFFPHSSSVTICGNLPRYSNGSPLIRSIFTSSRRGSGWKKRRTIFRTGSKIPSETGNSRTASPGSIPTFTPWRIYGVPSPVDRKGNTLAMAMIDDYIPIVGESVVEDLRLIASHLRGKRIQNFNSTAVGGGVAEILNRMVPLSESWGWMCTGM